MGEHHLPSFLQLQSWLGSASQFGTYGKPQRPGVTQEPRTSATGAVDAYRGNSTFLGPRSDARVGGPSLHGLTLRDREDVSMAPEARATTPRSRPPSGMWAGGRGRVSGGHADGPLLEPLELSLNGPLWATLAPIADGAPSVSLAEPLPGVVQVK